METENANVAEIGVDEGEVEEEFVKPLEKFTKYLTTDWLQNIRVSQSQLIQNLPAEAYWDEQNNVWVVKNNPKNRPLIWIPDEAILETLMKIDHEWSHFSWKQMYQRLKRLVRWPKLRKKLKR